MAEISVTSRSGAVEINARATPKTAPMPIKPITSMVISSSLNVVAATDRANAGGCVRGTKMACGLSPA